VHVHTGPAYLTSATAPKGSPEVGGAVISELQSTASRARH
jgi:hypothetical protein